MKRVTGIGGIFFRSADPKALSAWYTQHLGLPTEAWGGAVFGADSVGTTIWNPFEANTDYFGNKNQQFMVNFRVDNLHALLAALRAEGCQVEDKTEESDFGKFGWVTDPEGNRIELWEPPKAE